VIVADQKRPLPKKPKSPKDIEEEEKRRKPKQLYKTRDLRATMPRRSAPRSS